MHTQWEDQTHKNHTDSEKQRVHRIPTNTSWINPDHCEKKGHTNADGSVNTFEKRANELASDGVLPQTNYKDYIPKNKSVAVDENVAARKHDRNFSDLYG